MNVCNLCPRRCGVDRSRARGACRSDDRMKIGAAVIHRGEEPPLVHGAGSGAVFFAGCPMRCSYCQNRQVSQLCRGRTVQPQELAAIMLDFQEAGCSNVNLVSPTHYSPWVLESLNIARDRGLEIPVVVNSGGYESVECLDMWAGQDCIYLVDLKYGDNDTGVRLSGVEGYWDAARKAVRHLYETSGPLVLDGEGSAVRGLLVRHLVLPGMRSNPFAVLEFLADLSREIPVSVMSQYNPAFYTGDLDDMRRTVTPGEYRVVVERALELGFETVFTQSLDAFDTYNPDFASCKPFDDLERVL